MRNGLVAVMLVILVAGSLGVGYFAGSSNRLTTTATSTVLLSTTATITSTSIQTTCFIAGQPDGMFLSVASDKGDTPIAGAQVIAIHRQADDTCNGVFYPGQTSVTTFITNGTAAWYTLDTTNDGSYSFAVEYSGQIYNFSATMRPVTLTCATLYVPSGLTNVTLTANANVCS
jgi:hypothetical protein